jgi:hypothetical protein
MKLDKYLSSTLAIQNDLKQVALSALLFNFALQYNILKVQENGGNWMGHIASGLCWWFNVLSESVYYNYIKKNTEAILDSGKEFDLGVDAEETKYMLVLVTRLQDSIIRTLLYRVGYLMSEWVTWLGSKGMCDPVLFVCNVVSFVTVYLCLQ